MTIRRRLQRLLRMSGFELVRHSSSVEDPGFDDSFMSLWEKVRPYTMTSPERGSALYDAVAYVTRCSIPGAIVETGVWRGGSMMLAALTLLESEDVARDIFLFDTFEGMATPTEADRRRKDGAHAADLLHEASPNSNLWAIAPLDEVRGNMHGTGYPPEHIHLIKGRIEETIPAGAPEQVAILRLDTDWYESTRHALTHLIPRISAGGVLIVDDYGHWTGARKAVDEYIAEKGMKILLTRIDYTGRIGVVMNR